MAASQTNEYKNQKRIERKGIIRQSLFVSEYIQCKYPDIYKEVGLVYNKLNTVYPRKPDLRKCREFREWKNNVAVQYGQQTSLIPREKTYKYMRTKYNNMAINPVNEPPSENPTTQEKQPQRIMCLNIELMTPPRDSTVHETVIEEGDWAVQESIHTPDPTPQEPTHTDDPSTPQEPLEQVIDLSIIDEIAPQVVEKIIDKLRLDPELNNDPFTPQEPTHTDDPSTPQEPLEQVIDPTPQEPTHTGDPSTPQEPLEQIINPSIMDEIAPEVVEKIIQELHLDPDLNDLMNDIESQIEEEIVGLEVDIPELEYIMDQDDMFW